MTVDINGNAIIITPIDIKNLKEEFNKSKTHPKMIKEIKNPDPLITFKTIQIPLYTLLL